MSIHDYVALSPVTRFVCLWAANIAMAVPVVLATTCTLELVTNRVYKGLGVVRRDFGSWRSNRRMACREKARIKADRKREKEATLVASVAKYNPMTYLPSYPDYLQSNSTNHRAGRQPKDGEVKPGDRVQFVKQTQSSCPMSQKIYGEKLQIGDIVIVTETKHSDLRYIPNSRSFDSGRGYLKCDEVFFA